MSQSQRVLFPKFVFRAATWVLSLHFDLMTVADQQGSFLAVPQGTVMLPDCQGIYLLQPV